MQVENTKEQTDTKEKIYRRMTMTMTKFILNIKTSFEAYKIYIYIYKYNNNYNEIRRRNNDDKNA